MIHRISGYLDRLSIILAKIVEGTLVAMMVLTGADVFSRMILGRSIVGTIEIESNYFMVAVVFLPLAFGMITRQGHIRVDFVVSRFPQRLRLVFDVIGLMLSLSVFVLITWCGAAGVIHAWKTGDTMVNISLPMWPGKTLVTIGGGVLCLQIMSKICQNLRTLFSKRPED